MAYPSIVYNPGTGDVQLLFTLPPMDKPDYGDGAGDEIQPVRSDSFTLSGLKQSVFIREDTFRTLRMRFVPFEDLPGWAAFMAYAQTGGPFHYHPDSDSGFYEIFELDDNQGGRSTASGQGWAPARVGRGYASFDINMRKLGEVPGGAIGS